jgi:hypothetical protein
LKEGAPGAPRNGKRAVAIGGGGIKLREGAGSGGEVTGVELVLVDGRGGTIADGRMVFSQTTSESG